MSTQYDPEGIEVEHLRDLVDLSGARVLEVGCGEGRLTWRYAASAGRVIAIDPDGERLSTALQDYPPSLATPVNFIRAGAQALPLRGALFDCAILAWAL